MKNNKILILSLLPLLLTSCNNKNIVEENEYLNKLTKLDNFSISLPELKDNTKTYLHSNDDKEGFKSFDNNIKEGYQIISNILKVSTFYTSEGKDGWYNQNIMYYYPDKTYATIYIVPNKVDSQYFKDSYLICIDGTNYKCEGNAYYCVFNDENLHNELINYFKSSKNVAGDYVKDPRY